MTDTADKRAAALTAGRVFVTITPTPDGSIIDTDRAMLVWVYPYVSAPPPADEGGETVYDAVRYPVCYDATALATFYDTIGYDVAYDGEDYPVMYDGARYPVVYE